MEKRITRLKREGYTIDTDPEKLQLSVIHSYLSRSYWAKGIPFNTVKKAVNNSFCFGVYIGMDQVGFARVITDYTIFGHLADVFILEAHRGRGLSKWLLHEILSNPKVKDLRKWSLNTLDAHGLYKQFGFKAMDNPEIFMEIYNPKILNKE